MEISSVFLAWLQGHAKRWLHASQNCLCVLWMLKLIKFLVLQKSIIVITNFFSLEDANLMLIFSNIWIWGEALKQPIVFILCTKFFTDVFQSLLTLQIIMQICFFFLLLFLCSLILSYSFLWQYLIILIINLNTKR